ncbi:MAG: FHA domain-containing protein [Bacteroidota bacterium]
MKGFQKCEKGHFFKEELSVCPYCPKAQAGMDADSATRISGGGGGGSGGGGDLGKTVIGGGEDSPVSPVSPQRPPVRDLGKTYIQEVEEVSSEQGTREVVRQRSSRKIVGWLISYTLDPMGIDYRIYEGNNALGRTAGNNISIPNDPSISGKHATILFKKGRFFVRDEMAANGTFINNEELEIGQPQEIKDGDKLRLGKTEFIFKTPF